jgi:hypothetical protein
MQTARQIIRRYTPEPSSEPLPRDFASQGATARSLGLLAHNLGLLAGHAELPTRYAAGRRIPPS